MTINTTKQAYSQFDSGDDAPKSGEHKMTNREWLKSLSDEELAKLYSQLVAHVFCSCCDYVKEDSCHDAPEGACFEARVRWLKAEHRPQNS